MYRIPGTREISAVHAWLTCIMPKEIQIPIWLFKDGRMFATLTVAGVILMSQTHHVLPVIGSINKPLVVDHVKEWTN